MNYSETLHFLYQQLPMFQRTGAAAYKADLSNTIELCRRLGDPQNNFPTIHVAGTNGKGSVSHFIASILQEAGYKTGLFTSPHLKDFRERIRINGQVIPKNVVSSFVEENSKRFADMKPSFFEYTFTMAMQYFANEKIDVLVAETGMGGRLDSTNVTRPDLSIITNIGYDHMQFLGNTLQKIAFEKAGIIKAGIPVLIGQRQEEVCSVFKEKAEAMNAPLFYADEIYTIQNDLEYNHKYLALEFQDLDNNQTLKLKSALTGNYQLPNLETALAAIKLMNNRNYRISEGQIKKGVQNVIENTGIRGRWEVLSEKPLIICDTAHNSEGLAFVLNQIGNIKYNNLHFVLGVVADKDLDSILKMFPVEARYYFCNANIPRALPANELKTMADKFGLKGKTYKSVQNAYKAALKTLNPDDLLFIGGSTFVVAEIL